MKTIELKNWKKGVYRDTTAPDFALADKGYFRKFNNVQINNSGLPSKRKGWENVSLGDGNNMQAFHAWDTETVGERISTLKMASFSGIDIALAGPRNGTDLGLWVYKNGKEAGDITGAGIREYSIEYINGIIYLTGAYASWICKIYPDTLPDTSYGVNLNNHVSQLTVWEPYQANSSVKSSQQLDYTGFRGYRHTVIYDDGTESNPSAESFFPCIASESITPGSPSRTYNFQAVPDRKIKFYRLYRTAYMAITVPSNATWEQIETAALAANNGIRQYFFIDLIPAIYVTMTETHHVDTVPDAELTLAMPTVQDYLTVTGELLAWKNNRLMITRDRLNPKNIYFSDQGKPNSVRTSLTLLNPAASEDNQHSAVGYLNRIIYLFLESSGVYVLRETGNTDVPYALSEENQVYGCDGAIVSTDNAIYFIYKKKLWFYNGAAFVCISIPVQPILDMATSWTDSAGHVVKNLHRMEHKKDTDCLYISVLGAYNKCLANIVYDIKNSLWMTQSGDVLAAGDGKYLLPCFCWDDVGNKLYAATNQVTIVQEGAAWEDQVQGAAAMPVLATIEQNVKVPGRSMVHSLTFYGTNALELRTRKDDREYGDIRYLTASLQGKEVALNKQGEIITYEVIHAKNEELNLYKVDVNATPMNNQKKQYTGAKTYGDN
jgi:hypothetical protein